MIGVVWRLVSLTPAGVMLSGLVVGCGGGKEPAATDTSPPPAASPAPGESSDGEIRLLFDGTMPALTATRNWQARQ